MNATDLHHLSLIGRYAYGLACIESLCTAWAVDDPFVLEEIDAHWEAAEIRLACHWFDAHPFPRNVERFAARLQPGSLSPDRTAALFNAFHRTRMVICESCYEAANDDGSLASVLAVVEVLTRWGVEVPALSRFAHATWSGEFWQSGYGKRFPRESYQPRDGGLA